MFCLWLKVTHTEGAKVSAKTAKNLLMKVSINLSRYASCRVYNILTRVIRKIRFISIPQKCKTGKKSKG